MARITHVDDMDMRPRDKDGVLREQCIGAASYARLTISTRGHGLHKRNFAYMMIRSLALVTGRCIYGGLTITCNRVHNKFVARWVVCHN